MAYLPTGILCFTCSRLKKSLSLVVLFTHLYNNVPECSPIWYGEENCIKIYELDSVDLKLRTGMDKI